MSLNIDLKTLKNILLVDFDTGEPSKIVNIQSEGKELYIYTQSKSQRKLGIAVKNTIVSEEVVSY